MRKARIGITPEGVPSIGLSALATVMFAILGWHILAILFLVLTLFCCNFFRDPERVVPHEDGVAVSPADGKVIHVARKTDPIHGVERPYIAVFMNVFSVHVNRSPVKGYFSDIKYYPGKFINASFDKASKDNERCAYEITDEKGRLWYMVQIAGLVARRIVCRTNVGDSVERGERYGMIKFGSRVDIYLPEDMKASVKVGDKILAGQTIIAREDELRD